MSEVCPAYSVPGPRGNPGGAGTDGVDGINAFTQTTAEFTVPAVGSDVTIDVDSSAWAIQTQSVYIEGAGEYQAQSKPSATSIIVQNLGAAGNAAPGTVIPPSSHVGPSGIPGTDGAAGAAGADGAPGTPGINGVNGTNGTDGVNAFSTLTSDFTMPAVGADATAAIVNTDWLVVGQPVFLGGAGTLLVSVINSSISADLENPGYLGNAAPTTVIGAGASIAPGGIGATGSIEKFEGSQITIASINGVAGAEVHGLTGTPQVFGYKMICTTDDAPYSIGDVVDINTAEFLGGSFTQLAIYANATEIGINLGAEIISSIELDGTPIVLTSWRLQPFGIYFP